MIDTNKDQSAVPADQADEAVAVADIHPAHGILGEVNQHLLDMEAGIRSFSRDELAWLKAKLVEIKAHF